MRHSLVLTLLSLLSSHANLLFPAISEEVVELDAAKPSQYQLIGFPQSALNQTEVEIRLLCAEDKDLKFEIQYVLRSSPCDKEFFAARSSKIRDRLQFYFDSENEIPAEYSYDSIVYYKSGVFSFNCKDAVGGTIFTETKASPMMFKNVSKSSRTKRAPPGLNGNTIDGGAKLSLSSWHPNQIMPIDAIYFLVLKLSMVGSSAVKGNITVTVEWRQPHGYLSAIDYPLHRFYFIMCFFYAFLAFYWLYMCIRCYKDILRIQYWIGAVIILGMVEKAVFYSEYQTMNVTGRSGMGLIETAELISCAKRTMSRVLVIIVSVGYGVVKPRLGQTLTQVTLVGCLYFTFCAIEGLARVSKNKIEGAKQTEFAAFPLVVIEMSIFYWIFVALTSTMRTLRMKRNELKLSVYRHFLNTLLFAVVSSVIFMIWSLYEHILPICLRDWKEIWVDTAFWHVLFCFILVVIMILWRPTANNQRYAFTPLLDDSEDENDFDEIFNHSQHTGYEQIQMRNTDASKERETRKEQSQKDAKLQEDLKWIEDNIPKSITDHLLMDEEEDREARELERSKMQ